MISSLPRWVAAVCLLLSVSTITLSQQAAWKWLNPLPQGNPLNAVWPRSADSVISVGSYGTFITSDNRGVTWRVTNSVLGKGGQIHSVYFFSARVGWIVGESGLIFKTTDGGQSWIDQSVRTAYDLLSVHFTNANTGWACGARGTMYKTSNGGDAWLPQTTGVTSLLYGVQALTPVNIFAVGSSGRVLRSYDGGGRWDTLARFTNRSLYTIQFVTPKIGWVTGAFGVVFKTLDGGNTWTNQRTFVFSNLYSAQFFDSLNGTAAGGFGTIIKTTNGGSSWTESAYETYNDLYSIRFATRNIGWAVGDYGTILFTNDGGNTWRLQSTGSKAELYSVHFPSVNVGYGVGEEGVIVKTSNGGSSWSHQTNTIIQPLYSVYFHDELLGWAVGDSGVILKTTNGGTSWLDKNSQTDLPWYSIHFPGSEVGWAAGDEGRIVKSGNGGSSWITQTSDLPTSFFKIRFVNSSLGLAVGYDGGIYGTTNAGSDWIDKTIDTVQTLLCVTFVDENIAYAAGDFGTVLKTTDGGESWIDLTIDTYESFYGIAFANESLGWVAGDDGMIYRTTDGGTTWEYQYTGTENTFFDLQIVRGSGQMLVASGVGGTILASAIYPLPVKKWTGASDSLWSTASNWTPAGVPTRFDSVIIPSNSRPPSLRSSSQVISLGALSISQNGRLSIGGGVVKLDIQGDVVIDGQLTVDGNAATEIDCGDDFNVGLRGKFSPGKSTVVFRHRGSARGTFYNMYIGDSAVIASNGNVEIGGVLTVMGRFALRSFDSLTISNSEPGAIRGRGLISEGTIKRAVARGSTSSYRFDSPATSVQFYAAGTLPDTVVMTSIVNSLPPGFHDSAFVREFYVTRAIGGNGYKARICFRMNEDESIFTADELSVFRDSAGLVTSFPSTDFFDDEYVGVCVDSMEYFSTFYLGLNDHHQRYHYEFESKVILRDNGGNRDTATLGALLSATAGLDTLLGERPAGNRPPSGTIDARWKLPADQFSTTDFRPFIGDGSPRQTYLLEFQPGSGGYPLTLSWDSASFPLGHVTLRDASTHGGLLSLNMKTRSSVTIANSVIGSVEIVHEAAAFYPYTQGWNLVSMPLVPSTSVLKSFNYPTAISDAFAYRNGYYTRDSLSPGYGFWLKFYNDHSYGIDGNELLADTLEVEEGWQVTGSLSRPVVSQEIVQIPAGIISGSFYRYGDGYIPSDTIQPSKGYWVKILQKGKLIFRSSTGAVSGLDKSSVLDDRCNSITIADNTGASQKLYFGPATDLPGDDVYEMPPPPPSGIFDARFSSNKLVESWGQSDRTVIELPLRFQSAEFPLTISVRSIKPMGLLRVVDAASRRELSSFGSRHELVAVVTDPSTTSVSLVIEPTVNEIPSKYSLEQNFPNPFNPVTTIQFQLPLSSTVHLEIFNILGQSVASPVDDQRFEAGRHRVLFDGGDIPSGVYFYRMRVRDGASGEWTFQDVKKFMLIK